VLGFDREIDDFSSDDHNEDQLLEDIHEVVFHASVVLGENNFLHVLLLLQIVVLIG